MMLCVCLLQEYRKYRGEYVFSHHQYLDEYEVKLLAWGMLAQLKDLSPEVDKEVDDVMTGYLEEKESTTPSLGDIFLVSSSKINKRASTLGRD